MFKGKKIEKNSEVTNKIVILTQKTRKITKGILGTKERSTRNLGNISIPYIYI